MEDGALELACVRLSEGQLGVEDFAQMCRAALGDVRLGVDWLPDRLKRMGMPDVIVDRVREHIVQDSQPHRRGERCGPRVPESQRATHTSDGKKKKKKPVGKTRRKGGVISARFRAEKDSFSRARRPPKKHSLRSNGDAVKTRKARPYCGPPGGPRIGPPPHRNLDRKNVARGDDTNKDSGEHTSSDSFGHVNSSKSTKVCTHLDEKSDSFRLTSGLWFPRKITKMKFLPRTAAERWAVPIKETPCRRSRERGETHSVERKGSEKVEPENHKSCSTSRKRRERRRRNNQQGFRMNNSDIKGAVIVWFRGCDLRLSDNEALQAAAGTGKEVIPLYIIDGDGESEYAQKDGEAKRVDHRKWSVRGAAAYWLHRALMELDRDLKRHYNSKLILRKTNPAGSNMSVVNVLASLMLESRADTLFFLRSYDPFNSNVAETTDKALESSLQHAINNLMEQHHLGGNPSASGNRIRGAPSIHDGVVKAMSFQGSVMFEISDVDPDKEPGALAHGFGSVGFYLRGCQKFGEPRKPIDRPRVLRSPRKWPPSLSLDDTFSLPVRTGEVIVSNKDETHRSELVRILLHENVDWTKGIRSLWPHGFSEQGAQDALEEFLQNGIHHFEGRARHRADMKHTSTLSPYIRFGQISPQTVYHRAKEAIGRQRCKVFLRRLAWRDLAYWMLYKFPNLPDTSLRIQYEYQRWDPDPNGERLRAWKTGQTGYPLVDAGMRQLWVLGWMPNYIRHVVASFLIEYLNLSWKHGLEWFHDTLVDADIAINAHMWQNGGHSGVDQWNFVMHPVYAAKSCDPDGTYVRKWVPEVKSLPDEYVHCPWDAPPSVRARCNFRIGRDYSKRIVQNLAAARVDSLKSVLEVRSSEFGKQCILPDGNEAISLPDGRIARCITRVDYRLDSPIPITKQTIDEEKWQGPNRPKSKRDNDPLAVAMRDCVSRQERKAAGYQINFKQKKSQGSRRVVLRGLKPRPGG